MAENSKKTGGPAFPQPSAFLNSGMSLRDYFAIHANNQELADISYRTLSRLAQEQIVGRSYPDEPRESGKTRALWQLEVFEFELELLAKLRFMMADAMLAEREKGGAA